MRPRLLGPSSKVSQLKLGLLFWPQGSAWRTIVEAATRADEAGLDSIWTWDHLRPLVGPAETPIFEGWTTLAGLAARTGQCSLGLMVGAAPLRSAQLVAKAAITVDHISAGRCVLGLGAGSVPAEYGEPGASAAIGARARIAHLERTVLAVRDLLGRWPFDERGTARSEEPLPSAPGPVAGGLGIPILIGGSGARYTIPVVAQYADLWNPGAPTTELGHITRRVDLLNEACAAIGRDSNEIERTLGPTILIRDRPRTARTALAATLRANNVTGWANEDTIWLGPPAEIAERWLPYAELGFRHLITELPPPYDAETIDRLPEIREMLSRA